MDMYYASLARDKLNDALSGLSVAETYLIKAGDADDMVRRVRRAVGSIRNLHDNIGSACQHASNRSDIDSAIDAVIKESAESTS